MPRWIAERDARIYLCDVFRCDMLALETEIPHDWCVQELEYRALRAEHGPKRRG